MPEYTDLLEVQSRLSDLARVLGSYEYLFLSEAQLQDRIEKVLDDEGWIAVREYSLGAYRFDFFLEAGLVIETKVKGGYAEALRQVDAYLQLPQVEGVLLATSCRWAGLPHAETIRGKPVVFQFLPRAAF